MEEVLARFQNGIRSCGKCGTEIKKIDGCNWIECPSCRCGQCWICGTPIPHSSAALANHSCNPNRLIEWRARELDVVKEVQDQGNLVLVSLSTGSLIQIVYSPDWTVQRLKEAIMSKTGIPVADMHSLTCFGKPLENHLRMWETQIRHRSTVVLTKDVKGRSCAGGQTKRAYKKIQSTFGHSSNCTCWLFVCFQFRKCQN